MSASQTVLVTGGAGLHRLRRHPRPPLARVPGRRRRCAAVRRRIRARPPVAPGLLVLKDRHHRPARARGSLRRHRFDAVVHLASHRGRPGLQGAAGTGRAHDLGGVARSLRALRTAPACGASSSPRRAATTARWKARTVLDEDAPLRPVSLVRGAQGEVRAAPARAIHTGRLHRCSGSRLSTGSRCGRGST